MKTHLGQVIILGILALSAVAAGASATHTDPDSLHDADCQAHVADEAYLSQYCRATVPEPGAKTGSVKAIPQAPKAPAKDDSCLAGLGAFFGSIGDGIGKGAGAVGDGVASAAGALGDLWLTLFAPLGALLGLLKPAGMGTGAYALTATAGTAVVAGGGQAGSYLAWKKFLPLGLGLPLFSRIEKDELLENERRARIFELIKQNPGIHLSEIARSLDFAWGTTLHHLRKLRADRLVMFKSMGHHKSFFINGSGLSERQMEALSLVKNGTLANLAHYLEGHPRTTLKELSEALGISPPLAAFHIRKLEKAGFVTKVRDGKSVRLTTTEALPAGFFKDLVPATPTMPAPVDAAS
ncbi:MAG: winged helix-turn-helix transcriptional regulator [Euryarchaeota archaeon]|nr:winged helix-turn-helix transcriptional regulator [Euryarchaeota archaeon]